MSVFPVPAFRLPACRTLPFVTAIGLAFACEAFAVGESPDPSFGTAGSVFVTPDGVESFEYRVQTAQTQPDGRLVLGGSRNKFEPAAPFDPHMRPIVVRLNTDGSPDATFGADTSPGFVVMPDVELGTQVQSVEAMHVLGDGSILVAGTAQAFGPLTGFVAKIKPNGRMDEAFGPSGDGYVRLDAVNLHALATDSAGDIVAGGETDLGGGFMRGVVVRLLPTGAIDPGFGETQSGIAVPGTDPTRYSYINAIAVTVDNGIVVGGFHEIDPPLTGDAYWVARLLPGGAPDQTFGDAGSRIFRLPDSASVYNAVQRLLLSPTGEIVFGGYYLDDVSGSNVVLGRLEENGDLDAGFGSDASGFQRIDVAQEATNRHLAALERSVEGKLLAAVDYHADAPARQGFLVVGTTADGLPDTDFANDGVFEADLAPNGVFSSSTALTLQQGKPVIAGSARRDAASTIVDLAVVRLRDDRLFAGRFDESALDISRYDNLEEGFVGRSFHHDGVTYRNLNDVAGINPDGNAFAPGDLGELFIIENATLFYDDFPDFGSSPNALTFGSAYVNGDNLSVGALSSAWIEPDDLASAVEFDVGYYENGPWGGVEIRLDAYRDGAVVASDNVVIANDNPARDNLTTGRLAISGVEIDALHLYALSGGQYTAPRILIDNLALTRATPGP